MFLRMQKSPQYKARRAAAAIAVVLIAGSSLDRALAAETANTGHGKASKSESVGVLSGLALGAAAGGPFGAIVGAAGGGWLGDRLHRQERRAQQLTQELQGGRQQRAVLVAEIERLNSSLATLQADLEDRSLALAALEANSIPLDELTANVHFRTRDAELEANDLQAIRQLGSVLAARTTRPIYVTGFADARGAVGFNYELSTARAEAVADALVEGGLPRGQLQVAGAGAPASSDCLTDTDRCAFERRVTVRLVEPPADTSDESLAQVSR